MIQSNKISLEEQDKHCPDALIIGGPKGELKHFEQGCNKTTEASSYRPGQGIDINKDLISTKIAEGLEYNSDGAIKPKLGTGLGFDSEGNIISTQTYPEYNAGDGVDITNNTISAKVGIGIKLKDTKIVLDTDFTTLPTTSITCNFTDTTLGQAYEIQNDTDITKVQVVENGCNINSSSKYIFTNSVGTSDPERVEGDFSSTQIPGGGIFSQDLIINNITSDKTISVILKKNGSGLTVKDGRVIVNTEEDILTRSISLKFYSALYSGNHYNSDITESEIKASLTKRLSNVKSYNINSVTTSSNEYFFYIYPKSFGLLTNIIMDGAAPVLGAFTMIKEVAITTDTNLSVIYLVYKSNDLGAFTNNRLTFS